MVALKSQEHTELMEQFERQFRSGHIAGRGRLDHEKDKALWAKGCIYEDATTNASFLSFRSGYAFGRAVQASSPSPGAVETPEGWQPIETAPKMRKVMVFYLNALGKRRTVLACYYTAKALEMDDDYTEVGEYDEATGAVFAPEGWYEEHDSENPVMPLQAEPTHWMPLPSPPLRSDYGASLAVTIERGALVIRIGVQTLAGAVVYSDWANPWNDEADDHIRTFAITDVQQFAKDVRHEMLAEREDGSTPLSDFLDKMTEEAVNQGSLGLHDEEVVVKHGEKSPLETW